jgi:hypothetical protein
LRKGSKITPEQKIIWSRAHTGIKHTEDYKRRMSKFMKNRTIYERANLYLGV